MWTTFLDKNLSALQVRYKYTWTQVHFKCTWGSSVNPPIAIVQHYFVLYQYILNLEMVKSKGCFKAKYYRNNFL